MELRDQVISPADLPERLAELPGWDGDASGISCDYPVGWDAAVVMAVRIGMLAVEMAHRPDLDIRWSGLNVFMTTHTAGVVVTVTVVSSSVGMFFLVKFNPAMLAVIALSPHAKALAEDMYRALWSSLFGVIVTIALGFQRLIIASATYSAMPVSRAEGWRNT